MYTHEIAGVEVTECRASVGMEINGNALFKVAFIGDTKYVPMEFLRSSNAKLRDVAEKNPEWWGLTRNHLVPIDDPIMVVVCNNPDVRPEVDEWLRKQAG